MRDYSWVQRCSDEKLKELEIIAASQVSFRNIPLLQRIVVGAALILPFLGSVYVFVEMVRRASQGEQFIIIFGAVIGVALWALVREARRRQEVLHAIKVELERRS